MTNHLKQSSAQSLARRGSSREGLTWEKLIFKYVVGRGIHAVLEEGATPVAVLIPIDDYTDTRPAESRCSGRPKVRHFMVDVDHLQPSTEVS